MYFGKITCGTPAYKNTQSTRYSEAVYVTTLTLAVPTSLKKATHPNGSRETRGDTHTVTHSNTHLSWQLACQLLISLDRIGSELWLVDNTALIVTLIYQSGDVPLLYCLHHAPSPRIMLPNAMDTAFPAWILIQSSFFPPSFLIAKPHSVKSCTALVHLTMRFWLVQSSFCFPQGVIRGGIFLWLWF